MDLNIIKAGKGLIDRFGNDDTRQLADIGSQLISPSSEIQRAYLWEVEFTDPFGGTQGKNMKFFAKATGIPARTQESIKRYHAGVEYSYTGRDTSPRIFRVTFWDNQSLDVYRFINQWYEMMQYGDDNGKANPETYYRDISLHLKDSTNLVNTQTFVFSKAYPYEITESSLTYTESNEVNFDVMFHFTKRKMK